MVQRLNVKWAVATVSLGKHPSHTIERKFKAARQNGFEGVEVVWADLESHARLNSQSTKVSAQQIKECAAENGLTILTLNPLKWFEGNLNTPFDERLAQAKEWIELASLMGTSIIQMPSQFLSNSTGEESIVIPELQRLADEGAKKSITFAYEGVAFAQHNPLWQDALRVVNAVNRPNFKMVIDSFHIHARIWGDNTTASGILSQGDQVLEKSLEDLVRIFPKEKLLYVQLSDASRFDTPLTEDSALFAGLEARDPRLVWSRTFRPFPLEKPGYFPISDFAKRLFVDFGWTGWVSMESFLKETEEEQNGPEVMAARAWASVDNLSASIS